MQSNRSKFFKFLAGLAVSSSIFSSISVFCMENGKILDDKTMEKLISIVTRKDTDPKQELLIDVRKIFEKNKECCNLDDNVLFNAVFCLGKVVQVVYKSYVEKHGHNYAHGYISDKSFKSNVIRTINSSIEKNEDINGDRYTQDLKNAKELLDYKSAVDLMSTLRWRNFN